MWNGQQWEGQSKSVRQIWIGQRRLLDRTEVDAETWVFNVLLPLLPMKRYCMVGNQHLPYKDGDVDHCFGQFGVEMDNRSSTSIGSMYSAAS